MRRQDAVFMACSLGSMAAGVAMPSLAGPLVYIPTITMLILFFVSFLSIDGSEVWHNLRHFPGAVLLLVGLKLLVMPLACWAVFFSVSPDFALGAALLGGSSSAVLAPFFALLLRADFVLVLVGVVATSLLLPLALPAVLTVVGGVGQVGGEPFGLPVLAMTGSLALMTAAPFFAAQLLRRYGPGVAESLLAWRHTLFLSCIALSNVAIFSRYSPVIMESPGAVLAALAGATALMGVIFVISSLMTLGFSPKRQLAIVISCTAMNNVLMLLMSVDFFTVTEALLAAAYAVPFFCSVFCYRLLARLRGYNPM